MVKHLLITTSCVLVLSSVVMFSSSAFADDSVVDDVNIIVQDSCTLSSTGNDTHNATIANGIYTTDIGTTTLKALCNDRNGFAIYAIGYTDNEYGKTVLTSSVGNSVDIITGTATSAGNPDTSNWAMKLTAVSSPTPTYPMTIETGFDDYHAVPATYTKVASRASGTDIGTYAEGASLTTTYAAYIAKNQPAATYTGKVKYTLVHPSTNVPNEPKTCASLKICYFPNAGNTVADTMGDQSITSSDTSATLWASNFQRPGYGFVGWSDAFDYVANVGSESNPDAHIYGPNEDITFTAGQYEGTNKGLSLYAVWVKTAGFLQNWNGCGGLGSGQVTALTDLRDNDTYAIAKLADGNCWMIENLRLDYDANWDESLSQGFGKSAIYGNFIGLAEPETTNFDSTTANNLYKSDGSGDIKGVNGAALTDIGTSSSPSSRFPRYNNNNTNNDTNVNSNTTVVNMTGPSDNGNYKANVYSYGNYYAWAAALANTNYYDSSTATDANGKTSETANTSLCPTGWILPRGGDKTRIEDGTSDFYALSLAIVGTPPANYSSTTTPSWIYNNPEGTDASKAMRTYPNNFLYSGQATSSVNSRGSLGLYWSSTSHYYLYSYYLRLFSSSVEPGTFYGVKGYGCSIRCLKPLVPTT